MSHALGLAALCSSSFISEKGSEEARAPASAMVPPPIRTRVEPKVVQVGAEESRGGWLTHMKKVLGRSKITQSEQQEDVSEGQDDDLVCLSPLSQFFCNVNNPPDIYANMTLDGYCTVEELVQPMQHMADLHDRFRRRLVYSCGSWKAEVLEDFDVRTLMREVTLDGADAQQAYHEYMGQLMSQEPLGTHGLPPWDVLCIHYTCDPNRTDVLMRASHIIGDGQLFMKIIKQIMAPLDAAARADYSHSIVNARAGTPGVRPSTRKRFSLSSCGGGGSASSSSTSLSSRSSDGSDAPARAAAADAMQQQVQQQLQKEPKLSRAAQQPQQDAVDHQQQDSDRQQQQQLQLQDRPQQQHDHHRQHRKRGGGMHHWLKLLIRGVQWCWNQYTALVFSALMLFWYADPVTLIKASEEQCVGRRRWSSISLSLPDFHRVAKALGHTLNTLAVACLAGGVRRYLLRHGQTPARRIRMCGMVDTRSMPGLLPGSMHGASNNFSFIGVPLYTGDISPLERLTRVGRAMSWVRHSLVVPIAIRMPDVIQTIFRKPEASSRAILRALPLKTTVGFSNMKGPAGSWSLSGYRVTNIHNGVQPMAFGSFISLFSYDANVTFTHTCFETKTKQPEVLLDCIAEEYHCLRKAASIGAHGCSSAPGSPNGCTDKKIKAG